ncbi:MAG: hypothetical protein KIS62_05595 [Ramlibacter sp.]|nr:hypothetical protein [Ramlibacter sp.]MBX3657373.1 hypothetical protein [Ramlibacter sp.]MCW5649196.1 hypothetical protein [Ramlibacter sp.]
MPIYDNLRHWVVKTSSSFAGLWVLGEAANEPGPGPAPGELIYRLRRWPALPSVHRTASIYRTLSIMSARPVNRRWFLASTDLSASQADALIQSLVDEGDLEVINPARFSDSGH